MEICENGDSFDVLKKWIELQKLIKEEITLNHIVQQSQNKHSEVIKKKYFELYENKVKIREIYDFIQGINNKQVRNRPKVFSLVDNIKNVLLEYDPVVTLFRKLRNNYKLLLILVDILEKNIQFQEEIDSFIEMITHNFFENNYTQNSEKDEILVFIYILLEREIDKMLSPTFSWFLNKDISIIGKILKSYTKKPEVKSFASLILNETILKIENSTENFLEIDPNKIAEFIEMTKNCESTSKINGEKKISNEKFFFFKGIRKSNILESVKHLQNSDFDEGNLFINIIKDGFQNKREKKLTDEFDLKEIHNFSQISQMDSHFNHEYHIDLTDQELSNRVYNEKDLNMKDLYIRQINKINNNNKKQIYTNNRIQEDLKKISDTDIAYNLYIRNFEHLKESCDSIFKNLFEKLKMMPYGIRCICKMIHLLVSQKFPNIDVFDRNFLIAEFIFEKWIIPILISQDPSTIITSTIISDPTRKYLLNLSNIIKKINRSFLFESSFESEFTIFNHYIIEIMPSILLFYNKLIDINLPKPIDDIFSRKHYNYEYQFFKENPDQLVNIQAYCFSSNDFLFLYKILKENLEKFSEENIILTIIDRMDSQEDNLKKLMKSEILYFFLILENEFNPKYSNILNPEKMTYTFNNDIANTEFRLKRIKFCIKKILRGINMIDTNIISLYSHIMSTTTFFKILNKIIILEEYNEDNEKIPTNWYSLYLNSNISYLSDEYKDNNYKKLYDEILQEETKEIDLLKLRSHLINTNYGLNITNIEKKSEIYKKKISKLKKLEQSIKLYHFMKYSQIKTCVRLNYKEELDIINTYNMEEKRNDKQINNSFMELDENEGSIVVKQIDECIHFKSGEYNRKNYFKAKSIGNKVESHVTTIQEFIHVLAKFKVIKQDISQIDCKRNHKIYEAMFNYLNIVRDCLNESDLFKGSDDADFNEIIDDIQTYIERKIYKNVYPIDPLEKDEEFFKKANLFSWITPNHLEIKDKFISEGLWEIATKFLAKMDEEKSAKDKLNCVLRAYKILSKDNAGVDDINPILIYIIIKSNPKRMYSNYQFIQTFMHPNKLNALEGFLLTQIEIALGFISGLNIGLLRISKEEYEKNMDIQGQKSFSIEKLNNSKRNSIEN